MVLADTVGFIRHLPHQLVEAFQATLEEVALADLLLHVIDAAAHGSRRRPRQAGESVLAEIGADECRCSRCTTKSICSKPRRASSATNNGGRCRVWVSARDGRGIDRTAVEAIARIAAAGLRARMAAAGAAPGKAARAALRIRARCCPNTSTTRGACGWRFACHARSFAAAACARRRRQTSLQLHSADRISRCSGVPC